MRRGNGDGSIFKLSGKRRKPYAVRITIGWDESGKQKYKYIGYYTNKKEAKQTLGNIFQSMLDKSNFTEGTKKQYISVYKKIESLANYKIDEIKLEDIEDLMISETQNTQARIRKTLSNCYKYAMRYDYVSKNLADLEEIQRKE